jgi:putative DNA primase/helicase
VALEILARKGKAPHHRGRAGQRQDDDLPFLRGDHFVRRNLAGRHAREGRQRLDLDERRRTRGYDYSAFDADLGRIFIVRSQREANGKTRAFNPATDMESLREKAATISGGVDFVFLDPVVSAVPVTRNSDKNAETRAGLTPFVEFIEALNASGGGVTHVSKGTAGKDPLERVTGTLAYGAVPRIVLLTSVNKAEGDGEPERIMVRVKNNIGPCDGGFGFHIDTAPLLERPDVEATRIVWELPLEGTAIELMNAAEGETAKVSKLDEAKRFLREALAKGERPQKEIKADALGQGISWGTLKRASEGDEIGKRKDGFGGWHWWLS